MSTKIFNEDISYFCVNHELYFTYKAYILLVFFNEMNIFIF